MSARVAFAGRLGTTYVVPPVPGLRNPGVQLFLTSALVLFVELFLIRWISATVTYVGFFTNLVLIASFLGIGLGILAGRATQHVPVWLFPVLLFATVRLVTAVQLDIRLGSPDDIYIGPAATRGAADANVLVLLVVFALTAAVMGSLAMRLGPLFRSMRPLRAYAIDILGSLVGIASFTTLSWAGVGPAGWLIAISAVFGLVVLGRGLSAWAAFAGSTLAFTILVGSATGDIWSPYQRITLIETDRDWAINVNGIPHQQFPKESGEIGFFYDQVDRWFPGRSFERTLVIGAGNGNDVAVALKRGDEYIDAVEIDPRILDIGKRLHPDRPYDDPRVRTFVEDGRAFLRTSGERYDLIIFAQPDSLTLYSTAGSVRLESFLFTREAMASVRDHLTEDGVFVLYNFYWQPWLVDRLGGLLDETFGPGAIVSYYDEVGGHAAVLASGPGIVDGSARPVGAEALEPTTTSATVTDDWPFLYLRAPSIAPYYLVALVVILVAAVIGVLGAARLSRMSLARFSPHFFVLGTAFMLLETRSLVTFGLLFGNTWVVNAAAFFAILVSVLLSIVITRILALVSARPWYLLLGASLVIAWILPPGSLLIDPPAMRYVVAAVVAFAPVFFANLCFSQSFRDTRTADMAFASNLLGAVVGGLLEYTALLAGYQALLVLVALLYGGAYLLGTRVRTLADRDLEPRQHRDLLGEAASA